MISAIDTNVLLDVLIPNSKFVDQSLETLEASAEGGALVISETVFTELAAQFKSLSDLRSFLDESGIRLSPSNVHALYASSMAWKKYLWNRSKRKCPHCAKEIAGRDRIISDFMIGGHASANADRLITRDRGFYRRYFEAIEIVDPSNPKEGD